MPDITILYQPKNQFTLRPDTKNYAPFYYSGRWSACPHLEKFNYVLQEWKECANVEGTFRSSEQKENYYDFACFARIRETGLYRFKFSDGTLTDEFEVIG